MLASDKKKMHDVFRLIDLSEKQTCTNVIRSIAFACDQSLLPNLSHLFCNHSFGDTFFVDYWC